MVGRHPLRVVQGERSGRRGNLQSGVQDFLRRGTAGIHRNPDRIGIYALGGRVAECPPHHRRERTGPRRLEEAWRPATQPLAHQLILPMNWMLRGPPTPKCESKLPSSAVAV